MKIKSLTDIFFDLDHTLWDFDRNSRYAFERVFLRHGVNLKIDEFLVHYEPINHKYWKMYRENMITQQELRRGRLRDTFFLMKQDISPDDIDAFAKSYIDELPVNNYLFDGTLEILDHLKRRYRLHIITNGFKEVQLLKIRNSKIDKYFTTVTTSDEVGVKKPHPDIFYSAIRKASVRPEYSLMIGDSFEADIEGARKIGMHTLFFNHRNEKISESEKIIRHLKEIKNYL